MKETIPDKQQIPTEEVGNTPHARVAKCVQSIKTHVSLSLRNTIHSVNSIVHDYGLPVVDLAIDYLVAEGNTPLANRVRQDVASLATLPQLTDESPVPPSGNQSTDDGTKNVGK